MATMRALVTIGFFVTLGLDASIAMPPQDVSTEVKTCKGITDDKERLKCFDKLFSETAKPEAVPAEKQAENWSIEESKSPTDGSSQVVAANLVGDTVLILRCKNQTTEAAFSTKYNWLGSRSVDVTLRINEERTLKQTWRASIDGRAAFAPNAVEFIRMLPDNAKLFIKTTRADGKTKEANYDLGHVSDITNKIANACDWDNMPGDNQVGSVDHLNSPH
jgi:type VI secretion system VasI family protein